MAIPRETYSTARILDDSRFHAAALAGDAQAEHLVEGIASEEKALKTASADTQAKEGERMARLALLTRVDFELDDLVRVAELEVQVLTGKDRKDPIYRAAFPNGLSASVGLRGEAQAREVKRLVGALEEQAKAIADKHGATLEKLADDSIDAEKNWREAETAAAQAFALERIARTQLIQQMQKNEGALMVIYPGQRRRVRSFFRPAHRRSAAPDTGAPEEPSES